MAVRLRRRLRSALFLPLTALEAAGRGLRGGWLWLKAAYLTLRYVDEWGAFPAFQFEGRLPLRIEKARGARLVLRGPLRVRRWVGGDRAVVLSLGANATFELRDLFIVGEDTRFRVSPRAHLLIHGRGTHDYSGITAASRVLVKRSVEFGPGVVLSWGTYVTDSDWHPIGGELAIEPVKLGEHVLVTSGSFVLKGARIGRDCVVAPQSIVRRGEHPPGSLLAGDPAKPIKSRRDMATWRYE